MKNELLNLKPYITKVTGRGLYLGVHFSEDIKSREIVERLKSKHVIVGIGFNEVLRIKPPITINKQDIEGFIATMRDLLENYHNNGFKRELSGEETEEAINGNKKNKQ
jgi:acetylornithine/succinyldiaminopimelate/putrescine aminotransferase